MIALTRSSIPPLNPAPFDRVAIARAERPMRPSLPSRTERFGDNGPRFLAKRAVDLAGASVGLILLTPVLLAIALLIRLDSPGPVLFRQWRRGYRGRLFQMLKFRTMVVDAEQRLGDLEESNEAAGGVLFKLRNDPRVTRLGRFLRHSSLDELPQLINVVRGEMSPKVTCAKRTPGIATRPPQPRSGGAAFHSFVLSRELEDLQETIMIQRSLRPIHTWRVPPNWSPRDWFEELRAEVIAAAWEAEDDFDPTRGVPLEAFVQRRVWAGARRRYRREWTYVLRCGFHREGDDSEDVSVNGFSSVDFSESLRRFLDRLPAIDRKLIVSLFWEEKTEVEVARILSISRQAVHKRKRRILEQLRHWMSQLKKRRSSEN